MNDLDQFSRSAFWRSTLLMAMVLVLCQCGGDDPPVGPTSQPQIVLSTSTIAFTATQGGSSPPSQTLTISNGGSGSLTGLSASVTYSAGSGWLSVGFDRTTAPAQLLLTAQTPSLSVGTYMATVSVASGAASNSPRAIQVTCNVTSGGSGPLIVVSPTSVSFSATNGGANPQPKSVTVSNGGTGMLTGLNTSVSYSGVGGWLTASLNTTTATATLTLQAATAGLAVGPYSATVSIASGVASNSPQTVSVTLSITSGTGPSIDLSRLSVVFIATQGGPNPANQTVTVTNGGTGSLTGLSASVAYSSGNPTGWLTATLSSTTAPATLTVRAATGSLPAGSHDASVSISSPVADISPRQILVTFVVNQGSVPAIALSRTSASFSATVGGVDPSTQSITVTNSGTGSLTGLSTNIVYGSRQPTGWLTATISPTTAPTNLQLRAALGVLNSGTYTATVAVSSPVASNSPQNVSVTFNVAAAALGSLRVIASTSGSNIDPNGYVVSVSVPGGADRTANIGVSGRVDFTNLSVGSHTVTLSDVSSSCSVTSNPRTVSVVGGTTVETVFNVTCQAPVRQITLTNSMSTSLNIHDVVQFKVIESGVFGRSDYLTDDPAQCLSLPGESIPPGGSRTFDIPFTGPYYVFIGIGIWDLDNFFCSLGRNWIKRRFFTSPDFSTWYVWVSVQVNTHNGNWNWNIWGSYLTSSLFVTPAGNPAIRFNITAANPIP